jgi:hypothetical protein
MLKCQKNKFWLENITNLFCTFSLVPLDDMTLAEQMNALTRLVIVVFLVLLLVGFRFSLLFLLLSLLFIIILYYIQKKNMETFKAEYYTPSQSARHIKTDPKTGRQNISWYDLSNSRRFCNDERSLDAEFNNPEWMSLNQKLAGPPNPKTKIPPVVVAPSHDLSYWKANNLVTHSATNEETQIDLYQSGYQVSTCCAPTYDCRETCKLAIPTQNPLVHKVPLVEGYYGPQQSANDLRPPNNPNHPPHGPPRPSGYGGGAAYYSPPQKVGYPYNQVAENFEFPYMKTSSEQELLVRPNEPGQVNIACGYNPRQLSVAGLPTNYPAGNCPQDPVMKQYNENLYTQTIQPGVYTRNEINEPINANIGISFTQQFQPTTCKSNIWTGEVQYTEHDPRIIEPVIAEPNTTMTAATEANVYDPRFSGYGTSYRSYTDDNLGQTRFYYDDVNAIRMPNYVTRSNIDHQPFADSYGPIPEGDAHGNKNNANIRALANDAFLQASIQQRTDLQERLMRKRNGEMYQLRQAPIRTGGQRMMGGMGSCK